MITPELASKLPDDPIHAIRVICQEFKQSAPAKNGVFDYEYCLHSLAFLKAYTLARGVQLKDVPSVTGTVTDREGIIKYFSFLGSDVEKRIKRSKYEQIQDQYNALFGTVFHYELSDGIFDRFKNA